MGYIILGVFICLALLIIGLYWCYNNQEIALRKKAIAQEQSITAIHDKMWKIIQQSAGVTKEYADRFNEIYKNIMDSRYGSQGFDDGPLMRLIEESNPEFSDTLYNELQVQIESLRGEFAENQKLMLDIMREHETLCEQYPYKYFISNRSPIVYEVISSTHTNDILNTRCDDNTDLF